MSALAPSNAVATWSRRYYPCSLLLIAVLLSGCGKQRVVPSSEWLSVTALKHPNTWMNIGAGSGAVVGGTAGFFCTFPLLPILIPTAPPKSEFSWDRFLHMGIPTLTGMYIGGSITGLMTAPAFIWWGDDNNHYWANCQRERRERKARNEAEYPSDAPRLTISVALLTRSTAR